MDNEGKKESQKTVEMGNSINNINIEKIYQELNILNRFSPSLIMRKYNLTSDLAEKIDHKVRLMRNLEARKLAKIIER